MIYAILQIGDGTYKQIHDLVDLRADAGVPECVNHVSTVRRGNAWTSYS